MENKTRKRISNIEQGISNDEVGGVRDTSWLSSASRALATKESAPLAYTVGKPARWEGGPADEIPRAHPSRLLQRRCRATRV